MRMFLLGLVQWQSEYFQFFPLLKFREMFLLSGESEASVIGSEASKYS